MAPAAVPQLHDAAAALAWLRQHLAPGAALSIDSRAVRPGDAFIAWPGHAQDGRRHVAAALQAGAAVALVEAEGIEAWGFDDPRIACLPGLKAATAVLAHEWHGRPGAALDVIAVTGTNGKTSTAWWVAQALGLLQRRCALVGTLGVGEPPWPAGEAGDTEDALPLQPTGLTTPDPVTLHRSLRTFVDAGLSACAIEASSIGLVEHRLDALPIRVALFTNFTPDHLDFHGDMAAYWRAKRALFDWPGLAAAVVNLDDPHGAALAAELREEGRLTVWTYALDGPVRGARHLAGRGLHLADGGLAFDVHEAAEAQSVHTRLVGRYNASNLLAVLGALRALGVPLAGAAPLAARLTPVPGRLQAVDAAHPADPARPLVVVDYAHTPDALAQALTALRPAAQARGGRLWCVFGCGGNRDAGKRPVMGAIAAEAADRVLITSDNPRHEDPQAILAQIRAGVATGADHVEVQADRAQAIARAVAQAGAADVVLIAGKGHEDYQEVAGIRHPFSDADHAARALASRAATGA